jgi:hypothetical protein
VNVRYHSSYKSMAIGIIVIVIDKFSYRQTIDYLCSGSWEPTDNKAFEAYMRSICIHIHICENTYMYLHIHMHTELYIAA